MAENEIEEIKINKKDLPNVIESILFVAGVGVEKIELANKLNVKVEDVETAIETLKTKYSVDNGIEIVSFKGKVQLTSNPKYADIISVALDKVKEKELSKAALETIAIICYKQPITRLEIEKIRGVNCDYAMQLLIEHHLVMQVGTKEDAIGKPFLYGTTDNFLKLFQIESLDKLPDYEELLERIKTIEAPKDNSLYNNFKLEDDDNEQSNEETMQERIKQQQKDEEITKQIDEKLKAIPKFTKPTAEDDIPDFLKGEKIEKIESDDNLKSKSNS
jgi:segregation and condensation protein B